MPARTEGTRHLETTLGDLCDQSLLPADAPVRLRRDVYPGGLTETRADVLAGIHGYRLRALLMAAAPDPGFGNRLDDIIDDWEMPDLDDDLSVQLQETHTRVLGDSWQTFMRFRPRLLDVMVDAENRDTTVIHTFENRAHSERERLRHQADGQRKVINRMAAQSAEVRQAIVSLARAKPEGATAKLILAAADDDPLPAAEGFSRGAVERIMRKLQANHTLLLQTAIAELAELQVNTRIGAGGLVSFPVEGLTMLAESDRAEAVRLLLQGRHVVDGRLIVPDEPPMERVHASLRWQTDLSGQRTWQLDDPVEDDTSDTFTGLLLAVGVTPKIKRRWPKSLPLGGDYKQPMGPPQTPVLAIIRRADVFESGLVKGIERELDEHE